MTHRQIKNIDETLRSLLVIAGLLVIVFSSSLMIIISAPEPDNDGGRGSFANIIFPGGPGSMTKNEPFSPEKSSILSIPAVVSVQNYENLRPDSRVIEYKSIYASGVNRYDHLTTTASISPEKALEFTLVGAKPSGTS